MFLLLDSAASKLAGSVTGVWSLSSLSAFQLRKNKSLHKNWIKWKAYFELVFWNSSIFVSTWIFQELFEDCLYASIFYFPFGTTLNISCNSISLITWKDLGLWFHVSQENWAVKNLWFWEKWKRIFPWLGSYFSKTVLIILQSSTVS